MEELSSIRGEWNALADRCRATAFQRFEWNELWWKHLGWGPNRSLRVVVARDRSTIVGIMPLFLEIEYLPGLRPLKRLRLLGSAVRRSGRYTPVSEFGASDFLDFIIHPGEETRVCGAFVTFLREHPSLYDEVVLEHVPEEGVVKTEFLPLALQAGFPCEPKRSDVCPRLEAPSSFEEFLAGLRPGVRRRLTQAMNASGAGGKITLETVPPERYSEAFRELVNLHQARWNRLGFPGLFSDPHYERFLDDLLRTYGKDGWIWFLSARSGDACVASRVAFRCGGRYYDYLSGFEDRAPWAKLRPGTALLCMLLQDAAHSENGIVEFLRGKERYKMELTSDASFNWKVTLVNPWSRGTIRMGLYRWLRAGRRLLVLLSKERELFLLQYRRSGASGCLPGYVRFRAVSFFNHCFRRSADE
jgi:CelD/BcsL family acetyltransferase involved in cellulose biosynthesis